MATIAVVFGGGAAHGAYQAGVWAVLGAAITSDICDWVVNWRHQCCRNRPYAARA
ncbi:esterase, partial [Lacticaseibacillus paracasei subsp. paracasei CNCM I-4648]